MGLKVLILPPIHCHNVCLNMLGQLTHPNFVSHWSQLMTTQNMWLTCNSEQVHEQGRSQPHSPGWARVPLSSFFPQISIILIFPQTFHIFFLILAVRVGKSPTREGPGYATVHETRLEPVTSGYQCAHCQQIMSAIHEKCALDCRSKITWMFVLQGSPPPI